MRALKDQTRHFSQCDLFCCKSLAAFPRGAARASAFPLPVPLFRRRRPSRRNPGGDAKGILRGMAEKGWALDGFKGLTLLRGHFDVRTGTAHLKTYTEVGSPPSIKNFHEVLPKISAWEVKLGNLKGSYQEELSNRMKMVILVLKHSTGYIF